ncbi:MAG: hypothetical protein Q8P56_06540 [Candidatus Uhrbacteria bacterium]|nr:hypothetical protein [Candidatus Uhrbacteria bacterium]
MHTLKRSAMHSCKAEFLSLASPIIEKRQGTVITGGELRKIRRQLKSWMSFWDAESPICPLDQQWSTFSQEEKISTVERFCYFYLNPRV